MPREQKCLAERRKKRYVHNSAKYNNLFFRLFRLNHVIYFIQYIKVPAFYFNIFLEPIHPTFSVCLTLKL
jgi:hypothetical protein